MENTELEGTQTDTTASELLLLIYHAQINMHQSTKQLSCTGLDHGMVTVFSMQISLDSGSDGDKTVT